MMENQRCASGLGFLYQTPAVMANNGRTKGVSVDVSPEVFWAAFGAIATAVAAIAAVVGSYTVYLAFRQFQFDAWLKAQEIWTTKQFTEARGHVFARLDSHASEEWTKTDELEALEVCRRMDEFARLIPYIRRKTVLRVWGSPFAKAWLVLEPVVKRERDKSEWQEKWQAFEHLGLAALDKYPDVRKKANRQERTRRTVA
jgi:hypothetical protein